MKFAFIRQTSSGFDVKKKCQILEVSRSGYYEWQKRPPSRRSLANERLLEQIKIIHQVSRCLYGSPRIVATLKHKGATCGKNRVATLMRVNGIRAKTKKRFKRTTNSNHKYPLAANLVNQTFVANRPNEIWVSDITYIHTREGFLYLATVMDIYSRQIVGWAMDRTMTQWLVLEALKQARLHRNPSRGLIIHSDQGCQYASLDYQAFLKSQRYIPSMSRKGNCYDNACMESFFGTLKTELVEFETYQTRSEAKQSIFEYIEFFYNRTRLHSSLGYLSPYQFEKQSFVA